MGKINEYQRQQLASQAVGSAEPSRAGQIIGQAVGQFGQTLKKHEKEQRAKHQVYNELHANYSLMEWGKSFERVQRSLQEEYAADPKKYPEQVMQAGVALVNEMAENIADDDVRAIFLNVSSSALRQSINSAVSWSTAKQDENAVINLTDTLNGIAVTSGNATDMDGFASTIQAIHDTLDPSQGYTGKEQKERQEVMEDLIPHSERRKLAREYEQLARDAFLTNLLGSDPYGLGVGLTQGDFDDVQVELADGTKRTIHLDKKTKVDFLKKAEQELVRHQSRKHLQDMYNFEQAGREAAQKYNSGEWSVEDIQRELLVATRTPDLDPVYVSELDSLMAWALSRRLDSAVDDMSVIMPLIAEQQALAADISGVQDAIKDGELKPKGQRKAAALMTRLIKLRVQARNLAAQGKMRQATLDGMEREIIPVLLRGVQAHDTRHATKLFGEFRDPYGEHYKAMNQRVNAIDRLTDSDKVAYKNELATMFIQNVGQMRAATPEGQLTEEQYENARRQAENQLLQPFLKVGEMWDGQEVVGHDSAGRPLIRDTQTLQNQMSEGQN